MIDKIEILQSKHIVINKICLVKDGKEYITAFIYWVKDNEVSVELKGAAKVLKSTDIYHFYVVDIFSEEKTLVNPIKMDYEKLLKVKKAIESKDKVQSTKARYKYNEYLRSLKLEFKDGIAIIVKKSKIDKKQVGYLMKRAVEISEGYHEKAAEQFIQDIKQFNLTLINT